MPISIALFLEVATVSILVKFRKNIGISYMKIIIDILMNLDKHSL